MACIMSLKRSDEESEGWVVWEQKIGGLVVQIVGLNSKIDKRMSFLVIAAALSLSSLVARMAPTRQPRHLIPQSHLCCS